MDDAGAVADLQDPPRFTQAQETSDLATKRGTLRIAFIALWERYSFYNMFALLALFLSATTAMGGIGWSQDKSLRFFGVYVLATTAAPLAGGFIIERWISGRQALILGGAMLLAGHLLLALTAFLSQPVAVIMGLHLSPPTQHFDLRAVDVALFSSIGLVVIGNAFYYPMLSVAVGRLQHASVAARDRAFTTLFTLANTGGVISVVLGGWLSQAFGWTMAFGVASLGMAASFTALAWSGRTVVFPVLHGRKAAQVSAATHGSNWSVPATAVMVSIIVVAASFSYQSYGFVSLFVANVVDRRLGGFTVPPSWVIALNPITIMVMAPVFLRIWRQRGLGHDWSPTVKYAAGFFVMMLAFGCLALVVAQHPMKGTVSLLWPACVVVLLAVTELLTSPVGVSTLTRLAPPGRQALYLGFYGTAVGVGGWLSGAIGANATKGGGESVLTTIVLASAVCCGALVLCRRHAARLSI